jgi:cell division protein FtsQ
VPGARSGGPERAPGPTRLARSSAGAQRFATAKRDEREQRLAARRLRNQILVGGLVALVIAIAVGSAILYRSDAFAVKRVVTRGNRNLSTGRVLRLAGLPPGTTLLRLPVDEMQARLKADPWVLDAVVERVFPDQVRIVVTERVPVVAVDLGPRGRWMLDASGTMIATATAAAKGTLPLVREAPPIAGPRPGLPPTSPQLANAARVVAGLGNPLRGTVRFVDARTVDETAIFTAQGVEILMGLAGQMDKKDFLASRILADQKGKVVFIDVRSVDRPVWRGLGK